MGSTKHRVLIVVVQTPWREGLHSNAFHPPPAMNPPCDWTRDLEAHAIFLALRTHKNDVRIYRTKRKPIFLFVPVFFEERARAQADDGTPVRNQ